MKFVSVAIAASLLASTPAMAENFAGPRVDVRLGLDVVGTKLAQEYEETQDGSSIYQDSYSESVAKTGFVYGLGLGYDINAGKNFVVGVEANLDFANTKECDSYDDYRSCLKAGRDIELAVRGGVIINPNTLLYAKLGYANGRFKMTEVEDGEKTSLGKNRDGLRVGAGVETTLSSNLYLKVEYSYTDYKNWKFTESGSGSYYDWSIDSKLGFDRHKVVAGLGYRF